MYQDLMWLVVVCCVGIGCCITYVVCLLHSEKVKKRKDNTSEETLIINLDD